MIPLPPSAELAVDDTIDAEVIAPALACEQSLERMQAGDYSDPGIDLDTATGDELIEYADNRAVAVGHFIQGADHFGWESVKAAIQVGRAMNAYNDRKMPTTFISWTADGMSERTMSDYLRLARHADALHEAQPTSIRKALKVLAEINPRKSPTKAVAAGAAKPSSSKPNAATAPDTEDRVAKLEQQLADQKAEHLREKVKLVQATRDETASLYMPESERDRLRAEAISGADESAAELFRTFAVHGVPDMVDQLGDVTETLIALRRDGHADASVMAQLDPALAELMDEVNVTRGTTPEPNLTPVTARRPTGEELSRRDTRLANTKATKRIAELEQQLTDAHTRITELEQRLAAKSASEISPETIANIYEAKKREINRGTA